MHNYMEMREVMVQRIKELRKQDCYTQTQMAQRLHISRRTYANYERGVHAMPVEVLVMIADIFGTSLDYLTGRAEEHAAGQI